MKTKIYLFELFLRGNSYDLIPDDLSAEDNLRFILTFNYYFENLSVDDKMHYDYCLEAFTKHVNEFIVKCKKYAPEILDVDVVPEYNFYEGMFQLELIYPEIAEQLKEEPLIIFSKSQIKELLEKYNEQVDYNSTNSNLRIYESEFYKDAAITFVENWFNKYPGAAIVRGKYAKACAILDATYQEEKIQAEGIGKSDYFRYTLLEIKKSFPNLELTEIAIDRIINSIGKPSIKRL